MDAIPTPALPSALDSASVGRGYPATPSRGPSYEIIEEQFRKLFNFSYLQVGGTQPAVA